MPVGGQSPNYELSALGLGKESSFASITTPTLWIPATEITPAPKRAPLMLDGARQRAGQSLPLTGRHTSTISLTAEGSPDVLAALLPLAMGAESVVANSLNPGTGSPVLAYDHTYTLGPIGSFGLQSNRVTDAVNYQGVMISQLRFNVTPESILTAAISTNCARESINASPNTPMFGTLSPFRFQDTTNYFKLNGAAGVVDVKSWNVQIDTGLMAGDPTFGGGPFDSKYNQGQMKISGSITAKFNTEALYKLFLGNSTATSPANVQTPPSLDFYFGGTAINSAVNYGLRLFMGNCFITAFGAPGRSGSVIEQTFEFMAAETSPSAGDDLKAVLTTTASTAF